MTVSAAPLSPAAPGDFELSAAPVLTITAGQTAGTGTVTVTANDNTVDAPDKGSDDLCDRQWLDGSGGAVVQDVDDQGRRRGPDGDP